MNGHATAKMTLKLSKKMKALIEKRAAAENYPSPGDFVASLMLEKLRREEKARLDQLLKEGLASRVDRADAEYWQSVEQEYKARMARSNAPSRRRKAS